MRYEGRLYRPPSEARSYILQATIGCSWNRCTYCDMYRDKRFRVRDLSETLEDVAAAGASEWRDARKVFVADGDALVMDLDHWEAILAACHEAFPRLRRVSCYAMATNVLEKSESELRRLRELGLSLLYIGPESGDDPTLKRIAKARLWNWYLRKYRVTLRPPIEYSGLSVAALGVPVLFVAGTHDRLFPADALRRSARLIAGAEFVEIHDAGHSPYFEQPDQWNEAVLDFLVRAG